MLQKCFGTRPQTCAWMYNPVSELYRQFLQPHDLVFALTFTVNCGALHRQVCAFPKMSNQLNLPQVDSNQVVETSGMINGNRMYLSSISSLIAKGLNTHVNNVFYFNTFAKMSKPAFALSLWCIDEENI